MLNAVFRRVKAIVVIVIILIINTKLNLFTNFILNHRGNRRVTQNIGDRRLRRTGASLRGTQFRGTRLDTHGTTTRTRVRNIGRRLTFTGSRLTRTRRTRRVHVRRRHRHTTTRTRQGHRTSTRTTRTGHTRRRTHLGRRDGILRTLTPITGGLSALRGGIARVRRNHGERVNTLKTRLGKLGSRRTHLSGRADSLSTTLHGGGIHNT